MSGVKLESNSGKGLGMKRKKNFYKSFGGKRTKFTPFKEGVNGFLVTCNKSEHHAVKEAFYLLNKYADEFEKMNRRPDSNVKEEDAIGGIEEKEVKTIDNKKVKGDDIDLEQELEKEVDKMKEARKRFTQLTTKLHNVFFIEIKEPSLKPNALVELLFNDIKDNPNASVRYCLKIIPVSMTCSAHIESITKAFTNLLDSQPDEASYYIIPKVRANTSLTREEIIQAIGDACGKIKPNWNPDFDDPKLTIMINIVNKICCLSILTNFNSFKKYNPVEYTIARDNLSKPVGADTDDPKGQAEKDKLKQKPKDKKD